MVFRLPRLPMNYDNTPGLFPRYWDEAMSGIEKSINEILVLPEIQNAIDSANVAASAAQTAADNANIAAANQARETSLVTSYIDSASFTAPLISANAAGDVIIKTHTRVYGDSTINPPVSVTGTTISTGSATGAIVRIYYDDIARAGGVVAYLFSTDPDPVPVQSVNTHSVGVVEIPVVGSFDGESIKPPGYIYIKGSE